MEDGAARHDPARKEDEVRPLRHRPDIAHRTVDHDAGNALAPGGTAKQVADHRRILAPRQPRPR
jgi:hypothetical protein